MTQNTVSEQVLEAKSAVFSRLGIKIRISTFFLKGFQIDVF